MITRDKMSDPSYCEGVSAADTVGPVDILGVPAFSKSSDLGVIVPVGWHSETRQSEFLTF